MRVRKAAEPGGDIIRCCSSSTMSLSKGMGGEVNRKWHGTLEEKVKERSIELCMWRVARNVADIGEGCDRRVTLEDAGRGGESLCENDDTRKNSSNYS